MKAFVVVFLSFFSTICIAFSQQKNAIETGISSITEDVVKAQMEFLASDWTEGRYTGTKGCYLAGDYLASMFKVYGIQPAGDSIAKIKSETASRWNTQEPEKTRSFFQNFPVVEYGFSGEQEFSLTEAAGENQRTFHFEYKTDFSVQSRDVATEINAPVVFVGYGFVDEKNGYNDYAKVNVKGKVILRLAGYPGHNQPGSEGQKKFKPEDRRAQNNITRIKNKFAEKYGVAAIIEYDPRRNVLSQWADYSSTQTQSSAMEKNKLAWNENIPQMKIPDDSLDSSPLVLYVTPRVVNKILETSGIKPEEYEKKAASSMQPASQILQGIGVFIKTSVESKIINIRNVIGVIEGEDTEHIVVVGAHYDHLGMHDGFIWNGADDNASGTVGVLCIARACMATGIKPKKTIVFATWTGEEKGLLGSRYFVNHPYKPIENIIVALNYDMIGRNSKDDTLGIQCRMSFTSSCPMIKEITEKNIRDQIKELEIIYRPSDSPGGGSDHAPFAQKGIPVLFFITGMHDDYHMPEDELDKVNFKKMTNIIRLGFLNVWSLANSSEKICSVSK